MRSFRKYIFDWWESNKRDLPWRHTHDPYKILVSEIMLQQTQVLRVLAKYREFIERYPTVYELSNTSIADVIRMWKGLGYNRRALNLQKSAHMIVHDFNGVFPKDEKKLLKLPGVGLYTARAILVFAYKQDVSMVDTNIRRILTHYFFHDKEQSPKVIQSFADTIVPKGKSWEWHQALMDYGSSQEFTKIHPPTRRVVKSLIPFKDTTRFMRGRIIDLLRDGHMQEALLIQTCTSNYNKASEFIIGQIDALIREKLVSRNDGILRLG